MWDAGRDTHTHAAVSYLCRALYHKIPGSYRALLPAAQLTDGDPARGRARPPCDAIRGGCDADTFRERPARAIAMGETQEPSAGQTETVNETDRTGTPKKLLQH